MGHGRVLLARYAYLQNHAALLAFCHFPVAHWQHIRTTSPIESTFAMIRLQIRKTRNCSSANSGLSIMHQFAMSALKQWRRLRGFRQLVDVVARVTLANGGGRRIIGRIVAFFIHAIH